MLSFLYLIIYHAQHFTTLVMNQNLRKLVKLHNLLNVNISDIPTFQALKSLPHGFFFVLLEKFTSNFTLKSVLADNGTAIVSLRRL